MSSRKRGGEGVDETDDLAVDVPLDKLVYEDAIEDEFEQEIEWDEAVDCDDDSEGDDGHVDADYPTEEALLAAAAEMKAKQAASAQRTAAANATSTPRVWLRNKHAAEAQGELTYDASAYDMLHALRLEYPALSVAVLRDTLGVARRRFPHTMYAAAGTQADSADKNKLLLLKMSALRKTKYDDNDSDASRSDDLAADDVDDDDDIDGDAVVASRSIAHDGCINRLKAMHQHNNIIATWSENSNVYVWDTQAHIAALDNAALRAPMNHAPLATLTEHTQEGFAIDWSPTTTGRLLTGDCANGIRIWEKQEGGSWIDGGGNFNGHTDSVEDVQWSPVEQEVFASCSVDKTIKVWDARARAAAALSINAHATDVNVIDWSARTSYLMVSGADDGTFSIWDLRNLASPSATFSWHTAPISSVQWSPHEDSVLAVSCAEQVTLWDMSLERDLSAQAAVAAGVDTANDNPILPANLDEVDEDVPPQLLFVHQGQADIKEVHWHNQIPGALVSTAYDALNIWKAANV